MSNLLAKGIAIIGSIMLSNVVVAQADDPCLAPIRAKPDRTIVGIKPDELWYRFDTVTSSVCVPTRSGGCRQMQERRVVMKFDMELRPSTFLQKFQDTVINGLKDQDMIPKKDSLDTSVNGFQISRVNDAQGIGHFTFHAEKWWKMTGTKCVWKKLYPECSATEWKTIAWQRDTGADVVMTRTIAPDGKTFELSGDLKIDDRPTFLENLLGVTIAGLINPVFAPAGPYLSQMLVTGLAREIEKSIKGLQGARGEDPKDYLAGATDWRSWPRAERALGSLRYNPAGTGFLARGGSWNFVAGIWTDPALKELIEYRDFCAVVRPILENMEGGENIFLPDPPELVVSSGNNEVATALKAGETVWSVANRIYGNPSLFTALIYLRPDLYENSRRMPIGFSVTLPSVEEIMNSGFLFPVRGDSLWRISRVKLGAGSKYPAILDLNREHISDANMIYFMQPLKMP